MTSTRGGAHRLTLDEQAAAFEDYRATRPGNHGRVRAAVARGLPAGAAMTARGRVALEPGRRPAATDAPDEGQR